MSWGAALSIGGQILGGVMGMNSARQANAQAEREMYYRNLQMERDNNIRQSMMALSMGQLDKENELMDYYMSINDRNQSLAYDQMKYERDWQQQSRDYALADQQYEKYRITEADRLSAEERARQLEKLINDSGITAAERQRALEELDYTRSVALGERAYDVKKYEADQMQRQLEYQYQLNQYENMMGVANEERQFMINRQEQIMREAGILQDEIDQVMSQYGEITLPKRYGEADVDANFDRFYTDYKADADYAAEAIASANEAQLIANGTDASSTGDSSRLALLREQVYPLYNQARINARNDALGYVTGLQDNEIAAANAEIGARANVIQEILSGRSGLLDALQSLGNLPSAVMNDYLSLGSGVLDPRNLTSAGNYTSPLQIGSAVLNRDINAMGMYNQMGLQANAANINAAQQSGAFTPTQIPMTSPANFLSGLGGNNASMAGVEYFGNAAQSAANGATQNFGNAFSSAGQWLDNGGADTIGGWFGGNKMYGGDMKDFGY